MSTHQTASPEGYDSAMGFLNNPKANHQFPKLELNAMADHGKGTLGTTSNKVLGGSEKDFSEVATARVKNMGTMTFKNSQSSGDFQNPLGLAESPASQVPNSGHSAGWAGRVEKTTVTHKGKSNIFHG